MSVSANEHGANRRKRNANISSNIELLSMIKKVIIEEVSETSDITQCIAQYGCLIDSIQMKQDQSLAQMMFLDAQRKLSNPAPIVLEIVQPEEKAHGEGRIVDRRQIKSRKGNKDIKVGEKKPIKNTEEILPESNAVPLQSTSDIQRMVRLGNVEINQIEDQGEQTFLIPVSTIQSSGNNIELRDEDQNQIILPPELQQPILQLLATRGDNLRKITFTHNNVIQTIEILPPGVKPVEAGQGVRSSSDAEDGTHLIITSESVTET